MGELGLAGAVRGKVKRTTISDPRAAKPHDLVNRNFRPLAPDRLWVADFTYVSTWSGWCYTAFVIDAYARRILGWSVATTMTFGFNGIALPAGQPWLANLTSVPNILAAAHRARLAGADIVVLSMHWGTEYQHQPTDEQRSQARALLASPDIDVILGDHVHVLQPFEEINGKWVAYGMGNQISRHADPIDDSREGVMPRFTFTESGPHRWRVTRVEAIPTWMQLTPQLRLIDLPRALADPATTPSQRVTYENARNHIAAYLNALGASTDGLLID